MPTIRVRLPKDDQGRDIPLSEFRKPAFSGSAASGIAAIQKMSEKNKRLSNAMQATVNTDFLRDYVPTEVQQLRVLRQMATREDSQAKLLGNLVEQQAMQTDVLQDVAGQSRKGNLVNWFILGVAIATLVVTGAFGIHACQSDSQSAPTKAAPLETPAASSSHAAP